MTATIYPPELDRRPGDHMTTQIHGLKTAVTALTAPLGPIAGLGAIQVRMLARRNSTGLSNRVYNLTR